MYGNKVTQLIETPTKGFLILETEKAIVSSEGEPGLCKHETCGLRFLVIGLPLFLNFLELWDLKHDMTALTQQGGWVNDVLAIISIDKHDLSEDIFIG